jgi:hypothetical protein
MRLLGKVIPSPFLIHDDPEYPSTRLPVSPGNGNEITFPSRRIRLRYHYSYMCQRLFRKVEKLRTSDLPEKSFDKMPVNSYRMGTVCNMVFRCID